MLILFHIFVALASLAVSAQQYFSPSRNGQLVSVGAILLTVVSGAGLVIMGANAMHLCIAGIIYTIITLALTIRARYVLSSQLAR